MAGPEYPDDLKYTSDHEWVRADADAVVVGVTHYAQDALGDVVYVSLPDEGQELQAGQPCGEVESTKSVSDIYAPVSGVVVARNGTLDATPELINSDPYGDGWLLRIRPNDSATVEALLDADTYSAGLGG